MDMRKSDIMRNLEGVAGCIDWDGPVIEILLVGGTAGMLIGQLPPHRITQDCDIMHCSPIESQRAVLLATEKVAFEKGLPKNWLNTQAMSMNILPDGRHSRRVHIKQFEKLSVYAVSRRDLLAMKFYANRPQDRQDILEMHPNPKEIDCVRKYLNMLRVPSRQADLDQVVSALKLLDAMEKLINEK